MEVIAIVDMTHAYDHLWAVGRAVFDPEAATWVEPLKDRLYKDRLYEEGAASSTSCRGSAAGGRRAVPGC